MRNSIAATRTWGKRPQSENGFCLRKTGGMREIPRGFGDMPHTGEFSLPGIRLSRDRESRRECYFLAAGSVALGAGSPVPLARNPSPAGSCAGRKTSILRNH